MSPLEELAASSLVSESLLSVSCNLELGLWPHFSRLINGASGHPDAHCFRSL